MNFKNTIIMSIFVVGIIFLAQFCDTEAAVVTEHFEEITVETADSFVPIDEWDIFIEALIWVESRGKADAVGKTNDLGVLQITPIYVADANRILGEDRYSHNDALCPQKSLEMFEVVQSHYNPTKCVKRAISKHNPRAGDWYAERIYSKMEEIKLNNI